MSAARATVTLRSVTPSHPPRRSTKASSPRATGLFVNVLVSDVMSRSAVTVGPQASLYDALVAMRANGFSGLPVIDPSGAVVGVLSERDIARAFAGAISGLKVKGLLDVLMVGLLEQPERSLRDARARMEEETVREAMSSPAYIIRPDAPLELAAEVMSENAINRIPVVDGAKLVGIVTRSDLVRAQVAPS